MHLGTLRNQEPNKHGFLRAEEASGLMALNIFILCSRCRQSRARLFCLTSRASSSPKIMLLIYRRLGSSDQSICLSAERISAKMHVISTNKQLSSLLSLSVGPCSHEAVAQIKRLS